MSKKIFITGIDTDSGKTYATGHIAKKLMEEGKKVATLKFIQTGCDQKSEDIEKHREIMGIELAEDSEGITCPLIFHYPASAQLAAKLDNREIDLDLVDKAIKNLENNYDVILIEGAGGLMVPITDDYFTIDYIKDKNLPVILVTNGILGSINHTILSLEALASRGITVEALAYNIFFDKDAVISEDTKGFLKRYLEKNNPETTWIEIPTI